MERHAAKTFTHAAARLSINACASFSAFATSGTFVKINKGSMSCALVGLCYCSCRFRFWRPSVFSGWHMPSAVGCCCCCCLQPLPGSCCSASSAPSGGRACCFRCSRARIPWPPSSPAAVFSSRAACLSSPASSAMPSHSCCCCPRAPGPASRRTRCAQQTTMCWKASSSGNRTTCCAEPERSKQLHLAACLPDFTQQVVRSRIAVFQPQFARGAHVRQLARLAQKRQQRFGQYLFRFCAVHAGRPRQIEGVGTAVEPVSHFQRVRIDRMVDALRTPPEQCRPCKPRQVVGMDVVGIAVVFGNQGR